MCPKLECAHAVIPEGECCATCATNTPASEDGGGEARGCFFEGDKQFHRAGTVWHPYLPPFGFSRCTTCSCQADTLTVTCSRQACPRLDCPREQQVRPDDLACCKVGIYERRSPSVFDLTVFSLSRFAVPLRRRSRRRLLTPNSPRTGAWSGPISTSSPREAASGRTRSTRTATSGTQGSSPMERSDVSSAPARYNHFKLCLVERPTNGARNFRRVTPNAESISVQS